VNDKHHVYLIN